MCCDRNLTTIILIIRLSLHHWDMCCDRNFSRSLKYISISLHHWGTRDIPAKCRTDLYDPVVIGLPAGHGLKIIKIYRLKRLNQRLRVYLGLKCKLDIIEHQFNKNIKHYSHHLLTGEPLTKKLGAWASKIRRQYKNNSISDDRLLKLRDAGFIFKLRK